MDEQPRTLKRRSVGDGDGGEIYSGQCSQLDQKVSEPQNSLGGFELFYFNKHRWALKIFL